MKMGATLGAGIGATGLSGAAAHGGKRDRKLDAYALNVETWWRDLPFLDRFEAASHAGFTTVEMWGVNGEDRSPQDIATRLADNNLKMIQILAWFGPGLTDPATHTDFREAIKASIDNANLLGADMFTVVGHQDDPSLSMEEKLARLRGAYEDVLPLVEDAGKIMLLEPFNEFNHPGHFIYGSPEALDICRAVASPHLKINWDLFHMQRHEGELVQRLRDGIDQIAYIQVADAPDRHQPGTGEVNYDYVFTEAREAGYQGFFGLECWPKDGDNKQAVKDVKSIAPTA